MDSAGHSSTRRGTQLGTRIGTRGQTARHTMAGADERDRMAFRLPVDVANELREYARVHGITATEAVTSALRAYLGTGTQSGTREAHAEAHTGTRDGAAIEALASQLAVKDAQIERLMGALSQAQESVRAAQMLDAAHTTKALQGDVTDDGEGGGGESDSGARETSGILHRLRGWFRP